MSKYSSEVSQIAPPSLPSELSLLRATQDSPVSILNTTIGLSADENGPDVLGATAHILGEEVDREALLGASPNPKRQEEHLQRWLFFDGIRKNAPIEYRRSGA